MNLCGSFPMQWNNLVYDRLASQLVLLDMKMAFCWKYYPVCLQTDLCIYLFICLFAEIFIQSFSRT